MKIIAYLFALFCFATAWQSASLMGAGLWFWVIVASGGLVIISCHIKSLELVGAFIAGLLAVISICAVLLGLIAATIGGSFRLEQPEAMLLFLFFCIAVSGSTLALAYKRKVNRIEL